MWGPLSVLSPYELLVKIQKYQNVDRPLYVGYSIFILGIEVLEQHVEPCSPKVIQV